MSGPPWPPEILADIIQAALPPDELHTAHLARYSTLRSFSLVCRLWRDLAQPLLHRQIYCRRQHILGQVVRTLRRRPDLARAVRQLDVHARRSRSKGPDSTLREVLALTTNVVKIYLGSPGEVDLDALRPLTNLQELAVWGGMLFSSAAAPPSFAHLSHLSLCGVYLDPSSAAYFYPACLPALHTIAYVFPPVSLSLAAFPSSLRVVCNAPLRPRQPATALSTLYWTRYDPPSPTLLGLNDFERPWFKDVKHLRLTDVWDPNPDTAFVPWVDALPRLATLYIPIKHAAQAEPDGALRRLCRQRGVEIRAERAVDAEEGHEWRSVVPRDW